MKLLCCVLLFNQNLYVQNTYKKAQWTKHIHKSKQTNKKRWLITCNFLRGFIFAWLAGTLLVILIPISSSVISTIEMERLADVFFVGSGGGVVDCSSLLAQYLCTSRLYSRLRTEDVSYEWSYEWFENWTIVRYMNRCCSGIRCISLKHSLKLL